MFIGAPLAFLLLASGPGHSEANSGSSFGFISRISPKSGQASAYAKIVERPIDAVPGCLFFSVSRDATNPDVFWTIEFWRDQDAYSAAMELPVFKQIIAQAMPLVQHYERIATITPSTLNARAAD